MFRLALVAGTGDLVPLELHTVTTDVAVHDVVTRRTHGLQGETQLLVERMPSAPPCIRIGSHLLDFWMRLYKMTEQLARRTNHVQVGSGAKTMHFNSITKTAISERHNAN